VHGGGSYDHTEEVEEFPFPSTTHGPIPVPRDEWAGSIRIVQNVYEGGRIRSALRTARLTREQSLLQYQAVVADTLLDVRTAYYTVLQTEQQIVVQEASVKLLTQQLENTTHRFDAGTVPRFDVLRGEVELANARPRLIRAKNLFRIAKSNLANLLGYNLPANIWEDIPLRLTGKLEADPYNIDLPSAIAQAVERRPELGVLRKTTGLRKEDIIAAKAGYKPNFNVFAGYGARNSAYQNNFFSDVAGVVAGVEMTWDIFDGNLTKGKVVQAKAYYDKAQVDLDDNTRRVELEVRTSYSTFLEAREVLESQKKVQEQAEEALRLATSRYEAGTGTQLDVLNAQTSLTEARTTQIQALFEYDVARARLERAIGQDVPWTIAEGDKK
jgi:outer membrane protein TolC